MCSTLNVNIQVIVKLSLPGYSPCKYIYPLKDVLICIHGAPKYLSDFPTPDVQEHGM